MEGAERKSEIAVIPNKYKNTLNDLMDSSDAESLEASRSEGVLIGAKPNLKGDHLDKDERGQKGKEGHREGKKR